MQLLFLITRHVSKIQYRQLIIFLLLCHFPIFAHPQYIFLFSFLFSKLCLSRKSNPINYIHHFPGFDSNIMKEKNTTYLAWSSRYLHLMHIYVCVCMTVFCKKNKTIMLRDMMNKKKVVLPSQIIFTVHFQLLFHSCIS